MIPCNSRLDGKHPAFNWSYFVFVILYRQLSYVKEGCEREPEGDGVSALTSEERTRWAKVGVLKLWRT